MKMIAWGLKKNKKKERDREMQESEFGALLKWEAKEKDESKTITGL